MRVITVLIFAAAVSVFAQSEGAYDIGGAFSPAGTEDGYDGTIYSGLLDPARFTINHSVSFMAGGARAADIRSQSVYSTMMRYKFNAPVTLSLNFDMPIHSTFNQFNNFNQDNLQSMDYFRNMPIDAAVTWMPRDNLMFRVSVIRQPESAYFYNGFYRSDRFYRGW